MTKRQNKDDEMIAKINSSLENNAAVMVSIVSAQTFEKINGFLAEKAA